MESDLYTVRVESDVAGLVVRSSAAALESSLPSMSLYDDRGTYIAASQEGKVHMVAATQPPAYGASRVMVGIRDHKNKTLTLLPAAGEQVVRLRPRLADRIYDAPAKDEDLEDKSKRRRTTELVQAFGSKRRARLLDQRQVTQAVESNVLGRDDVEAAIADLGNQAEAAGLTTAHVMAKLSAERMLPAHDLQAMTAADAYQVSAIITASDLRHLHASTLDHAMKSTANMQELQQGDLWRSLDPFVRHMLRTKKGKRLPSEQTECSQWLAMYHVCRKMLKLRPGSVLNEAVAPLEGSTEEGVSDEDDPDLFAAKAHVTDLQKFANANGFVSPAAVVHFAERFGSLRHHEQGMKFQMLDSERQLLHTTLAVCVVRSNDNRITPEMGRALLKALTPTPPTEVTAWLKEIGCKVNPVKQHPEGAAFTGNLLASVKRAIPLSEALPAIKTRKRKRKI